MLLLLSLTVDLNFLITAVTAQTFIPTSELVIPSRIPTKEAKAENLNASSNRRN